MAMPAGRAVDGSDAPAYRPEIDGLRTVAILLVILCHYDLLAVRGGYVGVDVFFVISGFLITRLLLADLGEGRFSALRFYLNRARRLLPALFVMLGAVAVAAYVVLLPYELVIFGRELVAASLLLPNVYYTKLGGYFDGPQQERLLLHTWSLGVEEQFYALWPWLLIGFRTLFRGRLRLPVLLIATASLAVAEAVLTRHPRFAFYELPPRLWELALGSLIACPASARRNPAVAIGGGMRGAIAGAGLLTILWAAFAYDATTPFPGVGALAPCLGAALFILCAHGTVAASALSVRPVVAVGRMSYSLYLWHWPVFVLTRLLLGREPALGERLLLAALVVALAWLSWRFVERPFRDPTMVARLRPRGWIAAGAGAAGAGALLGLGLHGLDGLPGRLPAEPAWLTEAGRQAAAFQESACLARGAELPPVAACLLGRKAGRSEPAIVLWGDSHAAQWAPAINRLGLEMGFTAREITKAGCAPVPGLGILPASDMVRECGLFGTRALRAITGSADVRIVILAAKWQPFVSGEARLTVTGGRTTEPESQALLIESLRRTILDLNAHGMFVILLGPLPVPAGNAFTCTRRQLLFGRDVQRCYAGTDPSYAADEAGAETLLTSALPREADAAIVPLFPLFCSAAGCRFGEGGRTDFMDAVHLSPDAAIKDSRPIRDAIARAFALVRG